MDVATATVYNLILSLAFIALAAEAVGRSAPLPRIWVFRVMFDAAPTALRRTIFAVCLTFAVLLQGGIVQTLLDPPPTLTANGRALLIGDLVIVVAWAVLLAVLRPRRRD